MSIVMDATGGGYRPVVVCDHCEAPITDATKGIYAFLPESDGRLVSLHAGDCDRRYSAERTPVGRFGGSYPLAMLPICLAKAMSMDVEATASRLRERRDPLA